MGKTLACSVTGIILYYDEGKIVQLEVEKLCECACVVIVCNVVKGKWITILESIFKCGKWMKRYD